MVMSQIVANYRNTFLYVILVLMVEVFLVASGHGGGL